MTLIRQNLFIHNILYLIFPFATFQKFILSRIWPFQLPNFFRQNLPGWFDTRVNNKESCYIR